MTMTLQYIYSRKIHLREYKRKANEICLMKWLVKLDFLPWLSCDFFFFLSPGKHFISIPVWFIEASVIPSAPTVPDKSRAMLY